MPARLSVDIGNTETAVGVYPSTTGDAESVIRLPTLRNLTDDLLFSLLHPHLGKRAVESVTISSVVPALNSAWILFSRKKLAVETRVLHADLIPGIEIKCPKPDEVGVDRLVNTWLGFRRYGGPLVIVDMGTATTFDVVDETGAYRGGAIAPGVNLLPEALASRTAALPRIALKAPEKAIGATTVEALASGIVLGHASMVEGLLSRICAESGSEKAVATGGLMGSVRPMLDRRFHAFDAMLTLDGIDAIGRL